jgi:uncharacterized C2H2 Zn-finger protein
MFAHHKLKSRGFVVLYHAVPEPTVDYTRALSRDDQTFWIHDTWDGIVHDKKIFRAFVPETPARELSIGLQRFYKTFFPDASITEWRYLKTAGGAETQLARREFQTGSDPMDVCNIPGSLLVAPQSPTILYGYGWNHQVPLHEDRQIIELVKGYMVLFRGDYMYARSGSESNNVCFHAYLDTPQYARPTYHIPEILPVIDNTRDIDDVFCYCWQCPHVSSSQKSLQKHLNSFHGLYFNRTTRTPP